MSSWLLYLMLLNQAFAKEEKEKYLQRKLLDASGIDLLRDQDLVVFVDAEIGQQIMLPCHYYGNFRFVSGVRWYVTNFKWPKQWKLNEKRHSVDVFDRSSVLSYLSSLKVVKKPKFNKFVVDSYGALLIQDF